MANRLLLVEDNANDMMLLKMRLADRFQVDTAKNMKETEVLLRAKDYDAVLLDVGLPDYPRMAVVEYVKRLAPLAAIVVLSGYFDADFVKEAIRQNASSYLVKGCDDTNGAALENSINAAISFHREGQKIDAA